MDEAYCLTTGSIIGVTSAVLLLNGGKIPDRRAFRCPEESCRASAVLKAVRSTKRSPHFAAIGHAIDCEYASSTAGSRIDATELALSGDVALAPGAFAHPHPGTSSSSSSKSTSGPTAGLIMVNSRLTLRAFVDCMQAWSAKEFAMLKVTVLGHARRTSHLFLRASWLAHFDIGYDSIRWPKWMGPAKYADITDHVHIVLGEAIVGDGSEKPPTIYWLTDDSGGMAVSMASDPALFAQSKFRRRFYRDLASVGWAPERSAQCIAAVLCTARPGATGGIALRPAGSYEDVLLFPTGSTTISILDTALAVYDDRFQVYITNNKGVGSSPNTASDDARITPAPAAPPDKSTKHSEQIGLTPESAALQPAIPDTVSSKPPQRRTLASIVEFLRVIGRTFKR